MRCCSAICCPACSPACSRSSRTDRARLVLGRRRRHLARALPRATSSSRRALLFHGQAISLERGASLAELGIHTTICLLVAAAIAGVRRPDRLADLPARRADRDRSARGAASACSDFGLVHNPLLQPRARRRRRDLQHADRRAISCRRSPPPLLARVARRAWPLLRPRRRGGGVRPRPRLSAARDAGAVPRAGDLARPRREPGGARRPHDDLPRHRGRPRLATAGAGARRPLLNRGLPRRRGACGVSCSSAVRASATIRCCDRQPVAGGAIFNALIPGYLLPALAAAVLALVARSLRPVVLADRRRGGVGAGARLSGARGARAVPRHVDRDRRAAPALPSSASTRRSSSSSRSRSCSARACGSRRRCCAARWRSARSRSSSAPWDSGIFANPLFTGAPVRRQCASSTPCWSATACRRCSPSSSRARRAGSDGAAAAARLPRDGQHRGDRDAVRLRHARDAPRVPGRDHLVLAPDQRSRMVRLFGGVARSRHRAARLRPVAALDRRCGWLRRCSSSRASSRCSCSISPGSRASCARPPSSDWALVLIGIGLAYQKLVFAKRDEGADQTIPR